MIIADKFEVPDKCPEDCKLRPKYFDQGCICMRCPVLMCVRNEKGFCLVDAANIREDWAQQWAEYFKTGKPPILRLG